MTCEPETGMEPPPYLVPHSRESIRILYADDLASLKNKMVQAGKGDTLVLSK